MHVLGVVKGRNAQFVPLEDKPDLKLTTTTINSRTPNPVFATNFQRDNILNKIRQLACCMPVRHGSTSDSRKIRVQNTLLWHSS